MPRVEPDSSNNFKKYNYDSKQERRKLRKYLEEIELMDDLVSKLSSMFFKGVRGQDRKGHRDKIQFQIEPGAGMALSELYNSVPEGLFESKSEMYRSLLSMSIPFVYLIIQADKSKVKRVVDIIIKMNALNNKLREERLNNEFHDIENEIKLSNLDDKERLLKELKINKHDLLYFIKHGKFPK